MDVLISLGLTLLITLGFAIMFILIIFLFCLFNYLDEKFWWFAYVFIFISIFVGIFIFIYFDIDPTEVFPFFD